MAPSTPSERDLDEAELNRAFDLVSEPYDEPNFGDLRALRPAVEPPGEASGLFASLELDAPSHFKGPAPFEPPTVEHRPRVEPRNFAPEELDEALQHFFGFDAFRDGQQDAIREVLRGRDVLAIMPTGAGKSLIYQLPALMSEGLTLVISPLISLMKDQVDKLRERGLPAALINSSLSEHERHETMRDAREGRLRLLFVAPERFRSRSFRESLGRLRVGLFAVDEAHCVSTWGHDFRPDYLRLARYAELCGRPPILAVTATATENVRGDIIAHLALRDDHYRLVAGFDRPNLHFAVHQVGSDEEKLGEIRGLARRIEGPGIIYCATRKNTEKVSQKLSSRGMEVAAYHAGLSNDQRQRVQEDFMKGAVRIVCATNAFGLGIDKKNVRFVAHHDLPGSVEAYYQEAGRAGRDGLPSECLLLFRPGDIYVQEFMIETSYPSRGLVEAVYRQLLALDDGRHEITLAELQARVTEARSPRTVGAALQLLVEAEHIDRGDRGENPARVRQLRPPRPGGDTAPQRLFGDLIRSFGERLEVGVSRPLQAIARECGRSVDELRRWLPQLRDGGFIEYHSAFSGRALTVLYPRVQGHELKVDYEHVEERRQRDQARLRQVIDFAESSDCLRRVILRYFGAPGGDACNNCSGCRPSDPSKQRRPLLDTELIVLKKMLSCVVRMEGRFGRARTVQVLRGSRAREVLDARLHRLSTYGLLRDWPQQDLSRLLDECRRTGLIEEHRDAQGRYPKVDITARGRDVLSDRERVDMSFPTRGSAGRERRRSEGRSRPLSESVLDGSERSLFESLRGLRSELAARRKVKPFMILPDATLKAIARAQPTNREALAGLKGIGPSKLQQFGRALLEHITAWQAQSEQHPV